MKGRLLLLSSFVLLATASVFGQQDRLVTHFMYDKMSLNPGATGMGMRDGVCGSLIYRNQWDKVNGAPNSAVLNVEGSLGRVSPLLKGFGISFFHDAIGYTRQNNVVLNYSYHQELSGVGTLGIGLGAGITNVGMSPVWIPPTNAVDNSLPQAFSATKLDLNFGLYFRSLNNWYVGLSSTHLSQSDLVPDVATPTYGYSTARHYYVMGGWKKQNLTGSSGDLDLNAVVRTDLVKASAEFSARYIWKMDPEHNFYGGLGFRFVESVPVMLGYMWNIDRDNYLHAGYSYDVSVNKLSSVSRGSHEMMVKFCHFLPPVPIQKSKHPRWL